MCSQEPKADPSAVVPETGLRTSTVSCTYDVSHPTNSDLRSGGQSRRAELLTLPCAAHPQVATQEARAASKSRSSGSNWKGRTKHLPVVNEPFNTDALGLEGVGDELTEVIVARLPQDHRALDGAKHVTLLGSPVGGEGSTGGERGDGSSLVLPLGPGRGFQKSARGEPGGHTAT